MGFELDAFVGRTSDLTKWKQQLSSAVVCELGGELALVPVTPNLSAELRRHLGSASQLETLRRWAAQASAEATVVQISTGEFGNQSHEVASVWSGGKEVLSAVDLRAVLDYLRDRAGVDLGDRPILLGKFRSENAAEKWAAAATNAGSATVVPPRNVKPHSRWTFFGGIALFFSVFSLALAFQQGRYEGGGVRVQGVVTDKAHTQGAGAGGNARTGSFSSYYVMYRFTTTDGRTLDGKDDVLPELWRELKVGDPVAVEYVASSPESNQVPEQRAGARTFGVIGLATLVGGVALVAFGWRENRADRG